MGKRDSVKQQQETKSTSEQKNLRQTIPQSTATKRVKLPEVQGQDQPFKIRTQLLRRTLTRVADLDPHYC
jgi:hypothetical protein